MQDEEEKCKSELAKLTALISGLRGDGTAAAATATVGAAAAKKSAQAQAAAEVAAAEVAAVKLQAMMEKMSVAGGSAGKKKSG